MTTALKKLMAAAHQQRRTDLLVIWDLLRQEPDIRRRKQFTEDDLNELLFRFDLSHVAVLQQGTDLFWERCGTKGYYRPYSTPEALARVKAVRS